MTDSVVASSQTHSTGTNAEVRPVRPVSDAQTRQPALATPVEEDQKCILKWSELVAQKLMPVDWLVERLIPAGGVAVIGGNSGVGKSWLVLHIARCVAVGDPVLGKFTTSQGTVVLVDEENGMRLLKRRVHKLESGCEAREDVPVTLLVNHGVRIDDEYDLEYTLSLLEELKPKLVIFDSLTRIHGKDEYKSQEMAEVMMGFRRIQLEIGCAILFTHHTRKRGMINNAGEMLRGSTDIRAFVDTHIFMRATRAVRGQALIEHDKSRYEEALDPFRIAIVDDETGTATHLRYLGTAQQTRASKEEIAKESVLDLLSREGPMTRQEIIKACQGDAGESAVGKALKQLLEQRVLEREVGPRNQHTYRLSEEHGQEITEQPESCD